MTLNYPVQSRLFIHILHRRLLKNKSTDLDEQVEKHPEVDLYSLWRCSKAKANIKKTKFTTVYTASHLLTRSLSIVVGQSDWEGGGLYLPH